jgi:hypothetical protein
MAGRLWHGNGDLREAIPEIASLLVEAANGDRRIAYCGAAHLADAGGAFAVAKHDIRAKVRDAIVRSGGK